MKRWGFVETAMSAGHIRHCFHASVALAIVAGVLSQSAPAAAASAPTPPVARLVPCGRAMCAVFMHGGRPVRSAGPQLSATGSAYSPFAPLALTGYTWSGTTPTSTPNDSNWSHATNWAGGTAPSGAVGTLTFPDLSSNASCTASPATEACYRSNNNVTGIDATGLSIDDGQHSSTCCSGYMINGNGITLGSGGIAATPSVNDAGFGGADVNVPITLGAAQTWSITGGADDQQLLVQKITGSSDNLSVSFSTDSFLGIAGDAEVGRFTASGRGVLAMDTGSINGTDGNTVAFSGGAGLFAAAAGVTSGPIAMSGGQIQVGQGAPFGDGTLAASGNVTLDSTSFLSMFIDGPGTTPSTDYSQLTASGAVDLGNSQLSVLWGGNSGTGCPTLNVGDVDTLISAGSVTGTFSGVPDGTVVSMENTCGPGTSPTVRINYTSTSVTATVVTSGSSGTPTTTTVSPSPATPVTNQPVTLTATVGPNSASPSGSVAFSANGTTISGCDAQPLSFDGSAYTATCQTSFAAVSSPERLQAVFISDNPSVSGSASPPVRLAVGADSTTTTLATSKASPLVGENVTYTATVAPGHTGPATPSGAVAFLDGGSAIGSCSSQPVSGGRATCTVSYSSPGSHSITASYLADANFAGSASAPELVTAVEPAPVNSSPPSIAGTAQQGQTLTLMQGSWSGSPTSISDQWEDCGPSGSDCSAIAGATGLSYTLTPSDVSHTLRVLERASNPGGSGGPVSSAPTAVVRVPPGTLGTPTVGPATVSGTSVSLSVGCAGQPGSECNLVLALSIIKKVKAGKVIGLIAASGATKKKLIALGHTTAVLTPGETATITIRLNAAGKRLLAKYRVLKVKLTISQATTTIATKNLRFKSKRHG